jgi:hypothetical protein
VFPGKQAAGIGQQDIADNLAIVYVNQDKFP